MRKKILFVFGVMSLITIIGIVSCAKCGDNTVYKVVDLYVYTTGVQYNPQDPVKLYYWNIYSDTIYYSFFGIYIEPEIEAYASVSERLRSFGFVKSAYACDPIPSTTEDRITNIKITANRDYDDSHPKGSNLADYFDVIYSYHHTNTIDQKQDLLKYIAKKPIVPDYMVLILNKKPKYDNQFKFVFSYYQNGVSMDSVIVNFDSVTLTQ